MKVSVPGRGAKALENVLAEALRRQGCRCEKNTGGKGERLDLVVECGSGFYVCEAKWQKARVQPGIIDQMVGRLNLRPPVVAGVVLSMSGFTRAARDRAAKPAGHRTILLLGEDDTRAIIRGGRTFKEIVNSQLRNLISRGSL